MTHHYRSHSVYKPAFIGSYIREINQVWSMDFMSDMLNDGALSVHLMSLMILAVKLFYNSVRRHGYNDDVSPKAFEDNYFKKLASV